MYSRKLVTFLDSCTSGLTVDKQVDGFTKAVDNQYNTTPLLEDTYTIPIIHSTLHAIWQGDKEYLEKSIHLHANKHTACNFKYLSDTNCHRHVITACVHISHIFYTQSDCATVKLNSCAGSCGLVTRHSHQLRCHKK